METLNINKTKNKKIVFRADLNVPTMDGKITDYSRIDSIIPSLKKLSENKNKIFIVSHFGRPKGNVNEKLSIYFLCEVLRKKLEISKIHFLRTFNIEEIEKKQTEMNFGEVCLFENIRFYKEEENNDIKFVKKIASNFDIYINDAFSASHRYHSSIVGFPKFLPSFAGLNFSNEIKNLDNFLKESKKPNLAIIGGSKISTKIKVIYNLIKFFDSIVIGGAMANTFLLAKNINIGRSVCERDFKAIALDIMLKAKNENCKLILPIDIVCSKSLENTEVILKNDINNVPYDNMILDIGDNTVNLISREISKSRSVLWNGPLGAFEHKPFDRGSIEVANLIKTNFKQGNIFSLAGGGDTLSAINLAEANDGFNYLSNAGGAFLEWLEGEKSPGYLALN